MNSKNATQGPSFTAFPQLSDATIIVVCDGELFITGADNQFGWEPVSCPLPAASPPAGGCVKMVSTAYESK